MKTMLGTTLAAVFLVALPGPASGQDLQISMHEGRVTLIAENVPVSRILAEWARVGQATVVNGDKLTGPPVTLRFENQPEQDVLAVLLRSASGYIVAPRPVAVADASVFDRILIMPTSRPPAVSAAAPPQFTRPPTPPVPIQPDVDQQPNDPVMPPGMQPAPNPNMPATQPVPGMPMPGQPQMPLTQPRPGMPTPVPGKPGGGETQPAPAMPWQPVRPPGGDVKGA